MSQPVVWFCRWGPCIAKFDTKEERNNHVVHDHIRTAVAMTENQHQAQRIFDGSMDTEEHSINDSQPPRTYNSHKRKRPSLEASSQPLSLPSPPNSTPPRKSPTPTFAALESAHGTPSPIIPNSPSFGNLIAGTKPYTFQNTPPALMSSQQSVEQMLTQDISFDRDLYGNALDFEPSFGAAVEFSPSHSSLNSQQLKPRAQAMPSQSSQRNIPSSQDLWDEFDIPPRAQRDLQTQAPYQSQDLDYSY
ncbi:hypothetical protein BDZ89DRAFT_22784 [Hymenopellis radicata]|nr:hypothetical protein BDZ89DRAFT_22784 [Hymenopellis radicata]